VNLVQRVILALTLFIVVILAGCMKNSDTSNKSAKTIVSKGRELDSQKCLKQEDKNSTGAGMGTFKVTRSEDSNDYILPSDKKIITTEMLDKIDKSKLDLVRNEIYARHGYVFKIKKYKDFFSEKKWYIENPNFSESDFSEIEKKNIKTINAYVDLINAQVELHNNFGKYDLDNNGVMEVVTLVFQENSTKFTLNVNDHPITQKGTNFKNTMFIYDLKTGDNLSEIAIVDEKEKGSYETSFYRYSNNKIYFIGKVTGSDSSIKITGNGKVVTKQKSKLIDSMNYNVQYCLTLDNLLEKYSETDLYDINIKLILKEELKIQNSKQDEADTFIAEKGEEITFISSDDLEWIFVQDSKGKTGWIRVKELNKINGKPYLEVFEAVKN
jgi:hypothetical protein